MLIITRRRMRAGTGSIDIRQRLRSTQEGTRPIGQRRISSDGLDCGDNHRTGKNVQDQGVRTFSEPSYGIIHTVHFHTQSILS